MPFHVMEVEQIIGSLNGNTSAQAIQLRMRSSGQSVVSSASLWAWNADNTQRTLLLDITTNVAVSGPGAGVRILLATTQFDNTMVAGGATTFVPDFVLANPIPAASLTAGRLTFEDDNGNTTTPGTIYWSVAWGGASYTGSNTGNTTNDSDGNFGPAFNGPLPGGFRGLLFNGTLTNPSNGSNATDYVVSGSPTTVTRNSGAAFTVVPEPGNVALLAVGALALGGFAFARRRGARGRA